MTPEIDKSVAKSKASSVTVICFVFASSEIQESDLTLPFFIRKES
jgi:hypothetical protein